MQMEDEKKTVLIVDDDVMVLRVLRRLFRNENFEFITCSDAGDALIILAERRIDLLMADHRMPGLDGLELLQMAKNMYPDTKRMIVSGSVSQDVFKDAIDSGLVDAYVPKPWKNDVLHKLVWECIS